MNILYLKNYKLILILLNIIFCIFLFLNSAKSYNVNTYVVPSSHGDSHQYLNISVNILKNKTISHDSPTSDQVTPAYYREFYYPLYLSFFYTFLDWEFDYSNCTNETKIKQCESFYKTILISQIFLVFLCFLNIVLLFNKKPFRAIFCCALIFFLFNEKNSIFYIGPEFLSAIIFFNFCFFLVKSAYTVKTRYLFITIFFLVSLIFIKNVFYYLPFFGIFFSIIIIFYKNIKNYYLIKKFYLDYDYSTRILIISACSLILLSPYQLRNLIYFDDTSLSKRSHEALFMRNEFLNASYKQLTSGFYYYSPNLFGYKNNKLKKIQKNSFFFEGNVQSYYRNYTKKSGYSVGYINNKFGTNYNSFDEMEINIRDKLIKTNVEIYLKNFIKQAYISVIIYFRGLNENYNINTENYVKNFLFDLLNYTVNLYFLFILYNSIKKKNIPNILFLFPSFYFIFMMSTLTQTEPRMNNTILIFLIYITVLGNKKIGIDKET